MLSHPHWRIPPAPELVHDRRQGWGARDPKTVVFRLKFATGRVYCPALTNAFAFIYLKDKLKKGQRWYEKNILGSGPFKFVARRGNEFRGVRNPDYYHEGVSDLGILQASSPISSRSGSRRSVAGSRCDGCTIASAAAGSVDGSDGSLRLARRSPPARNAAPRGAVLMLSPEAIFPCIRAMRVSIGALTHSHVPMAHGGYATT